MNPSRLEPNESVSHRPSWLLRLTHLRGYLLAILSVGAALGASLLLEQFHFRVPAVALLLLAMAVSSWYGGTGPAVLAFILSISAFYYYFVEPVRTIYMYPSEIPFFLTFVGCAALLSWSGTIRRRVDKDLSDRAELLNLTHDTVFVMDLEGVIRFWNRGAEERYGWSTEQAVGKVVHDMLTTVFPSPLEEIKAEVTRTGRWEGELLHTGKDGTQLAVASRWALQRDERGAPAVILETNNDITERKRTEEALRRSEAYLAEAQRLTHTGAWALNVATRKYAYASEEALRVFGFDPQKGPPTRDQLYERIHPEDRDRAKQASERMYREKVEIKAEYRYRIVLPDGTVKHVHEIGHPVFDENGQVTEYLCTTVDITDRERAEEERERLRQLEADLAHINRVSMMGELAASIAHEVNQPLSGIVSNASACLRWLARDAPDVEELREAVRDIVRDGKRAGEVVARIRALTKRATTTREMLDLNETIREVLALLGDEARRSGVIVRTQFTDDLSPVAGDPVQLQQVVLNLALNAIEAMGSISDRARELVITTRNIDAGHVQATVEDSGIGLDPNTIDKIFDSFYTTKPDGMGMGLTLSRSILQAHGGRLWATVKDSSGTMFHFTVPKYHEEGAHAGATGA